MKSNKVQFERKLLHHKPGTWELVDKFSGEGIHTLEWFFHFSPGLDFQVGGHGTIKVLKDGRSIIDILLPITFEDYQIRDTWCSYQYGIKGLNKELHTKWQGSVENNDVDFRWKFEHTN
jgi:hypothetical protein